MPKHTFQKPCFVCQTRRVPEVCYIRMQIGQNVLKWFLVLAILQLQALLQVIWKQLFWCHDVCLRSCNKIFHLYTVRYFIPQRDLLCSEFMQASKLLYILQPCSLKFDRYASGEFGMWNVTIYVFKKIFNCKRM